MEPSRKIRMEIPRATQGVRSKITDFIETDVYEKGLDDLLRTRSLAGKMLRDAKNGPEDNKALGEFIEKIDLLVEELGFIEQIEEETSKSIDEMSLDELSQHANWIGLQIGALESLKTKLFDLDKIRKNLEDRIRAVKSLIEQREEAEKEKEAKTEAKPIEELTIEEIKAELETEKRKIEELWQELMEIRRENCGANSKANENHPDVNDDNFFVRPEEGSFGVFDGVGGQPDGHWASQNASEGIKRSLRILSKDYTGPKDALEYLVKCLKKANENLWEKNKDKHKRLRPATTATLLQLCEDAEGRKMATIAYVGDCRVYGLREDGSLEHLTIDDNYFSFILKNGDADKSDKEIKEIQKKIANNEEVPSEIQRLHKLHSDIVLQTLGTEEEIKPKEVLVDITGFKKLLIVSDGIYDPVSDQKIRERLASDGSSQEIARGLIEDAEEENKDKNNLRGKNDDKTAIVINL